MDIKVYNNTKKDISTFKDFIRSRCILLEEIHHDNDLVMMGEYQFIFQRYADHRNTTKYWKVEVTLLIDSIEIIEVI